MDKWKSRGGKSQTRRRTEERRSEVREKVAKSRNTAFFQLFVAPEGRKVGSLKAAGAGPSGHMRDEKLHAVVAQSTFASEKLKRLHVRSTFGT